MSRKLKQAAVVFVAVFAAAQVVRPERANPATDVSRSSASVVQTNDCGSCSTSSARWPDPGRRLRRTRASSAARRTDLNRYCASCFSGVCGLVPLSRAAASSTVRSATCGSSVTVSSARSSSDTIPSGTARSRTQSSSGAQ